MPIDNAYSWVKFVHVLAVLGFLASHGASVSVAFKLRGERDLERVRALLDLSRAYLSAMYGSLGVLLLAGIAAGVMGGWFTRSLWIWMALALLFGIMVGMYYIGTSHFNELRMAAGLPYATGAASSRRSTLPRRLSWRSSSRRAGRGNSPRSASEASRSSRS